MRNENYRIKYIQIHGWKMWEPAETQYHKQRPRPGMVNIPLITMVMTWGWFMKLGLPHYSLDNNKITIMIIMIMILLILHDNSNLDNNK